MELGFKVHVFVCLNQRPEGHPLGCCVSKKTPMILQWFADSMAQHGVDAGNRLNQSGCLGYCALGPAVVVYPQGVWYSPQTQEDVEEIVTSHFRDGEVVERLKMRPPTFD